MDHGLDNSSTEIMDVCSITLDKGPCGVGLPSDLDMKKGSVIALPCQKYVFFSCQLTDTIVHVADILHCAARTNLTMSEKTITRIVVELTERLNWLVKDFSKAVRSSVLKFFVKTEVDKSLSNGVTA